jgi:hypothetical protein
LTKNKDYGIVVTRLMTGGEKKMKSKNKRYEISYQVVLTLTAKNQKEFGNSVKTITDALERHFPEVNIKVEEGKVKKLLF